MKYENFDAAATLVKEIRKREDMLNDLRSQRLMVSLRNEGESGVIMTIGANEGYEHEFTALAIEFKSKLIADINYRLIMLKGELDKL